MPNIALTPEGPSKVAYSRERALAMTAVINIGRDIAGTTPRKRHAHTYAALVPWSYITELRDALDKLGEMGNWR